MVRDFSLDRLTDLLQLERVVFWRHDVDYSLAAAEKMAILEHQLGVQSTYYLMTDNPFYSPEETFRLTLKLQELGHRIGWHVDPRKKDAATLAQEAPGAQVSFHCPRDADLWQRFDGFHSAYDPQWQGRYYADSRGRFSYGDPEDHSDDGFSFLQVCLHPEWWFDHEWYANVPDDLYEQFFYEPKSNLWT